MKIWPLPHPLSLLFKLYKRTKCLCSLKCFIRLGKLKKHSQSSHYNLYATKPAWEATLSTFFALTDGIVPLMPILWWMIWASPNLHQIIRHCFYIVMWLVHTHWVFQIMHHNLAVLKGWCWLLGKALLPSVAIAIGICGPFLIYLLLF